MHDTIKDYFENLNPICYLSEQSKGIVLKNSELKELKKGKFLFKRGEVDNKSYFLLEGVVELQSPKNTFEVHPGTDTSSYALAQFQPRQYSAYVKKNAVFLSIDKKLLDSLADKDGIYSSDRTTGMVVSEDTAQAEDDIDWMSRILQSDLFSKLPPSNIQKIFSRIEPIEVNKGEIIVQQDDPGDYFYIIEVGKAEVIRKTNQSKDLIRLESLSIGDYFGEEALISEYPRNASVVMKTNGDLMRLQKDDFIELLRDPILRSYKLEELEELHNQGAEWIDVRFPKEFLEDEEFAKLDIPLHVIRKQVENLDLKKKYIVCCEDGSQSAIASFLLALRGFDAAFLEGGLNNYKEQAEKGLDLSFLNEKLEEQKDSKVIDFIPRKASKVKDKTLNKKTKKEPVSKPSKSAEHSLDEQKRLIDEQLQAEAKKYKQQSSKKLVEQAKKIKTTDEKKLAEQIEKQKQEIEKQLAKEAAKQKQEIEKQLAKETAKQKKEIEKQLAEDAKKEKQALEKILAEERAKLKKQAEKKLADEAAKQKKEIEKQLAEDAKKEKQALEKQLAEERAKQKSAVEKQLAEEAAKQKKDIEQQLKEELKKEKAAVEKQLAEERAKQRAIVEKQLAEEAAKQKKEIEKQLKDEAQREKKAIEKQLAEERAKQKAAVEKQLAEEKIKQKKLIELQLIEERAKQKAAVEKQLEEERAKQKEAVEKQLKDEVERQKKAIEDQMAKEVAKKKQEVEKQLAQEAERRKKAIEEKLAEQEQKQKEVIDDIIRTGKTQEHVQHQEENTSTPDDTRTENSDSINKLLNHYRVEKEKVLENIRNKNENRVAEKLSKIKSVNAEKKKESQNLKQLKQKVTESLASKNNNQKSQETDKQVVADKHKVLTKRYNILNDPRFREHINRLNAEQEEEFLNEIKSFKKELDMEISDSHVIPDSETQSNIHTGKITSEVDDTHNIEDKSDETIAQDIDSWIEEQELIESSPKRKELMQEKSKLMQKLKKQNMEDKKIDKIRNQTLLTEIQSALDKKTDD